jgi:hypothetical protein
MAKSRKALAETGWLLLAVGVIGCICDLVRTGLDLGRTAGWWP